TAGAAAPALDRAPTVDAPAVPAAPLASLSMRAAGVAVPARRAFDPLAFAFAIYSAGVVLLLARLAAEQLALSRAARRARVVDDPEWLGSVGASARQMGIERQVRLLRTEDEVMPFTFGTRQPTIVLPAAAERWSDDRRRAVLVHELAHVARADCLAQRLAALACALYWPHPGVWWTARRLRVERELACDDRVLAMGTAPREYADHLLEIAHAFRGTPAPATALGMARARQLESRLLAVMDDARNRRALRRGRQFAAAGVSAALLLPMASLRADIVTYQKDQHAVAAASTASIDAAPTKTEIKSEMKTEMKASKTMETVAQDRGGFTTSDYTGTWELRLSREPGMVQVSLRTAHSSNSTRVPISRFEGLTDVHMTAAVRDGRIVDGTVHFESRREAGTFTFDGNCRDQMCAGTYRFEPDPAFASALAKYGLGAPTASQQYELAMEDVGTSYLEGLKSEGYAIPDTETLVRAATHGLSLDYVKAMAALGYKLGTLEPLIRMRDHGVDPDYVRGMASYGFKNFTADDLVRLRDHGVDPEYVKGMREAGFGSLTIDQLVKARDHGVDPMYASDMAAAGYKGLSMTDLLRARDHGVDPRFVQAMAALGYGSLPFDALIEARDHGIDSQYAGGLASFGYKNLPLDSLVRLRDHGIDPDYVGGLATLGYKNLPLDSLIRLRDHGVDPRYVDGLAALGYKDLPVDSLVRLRDHGVDPPYVRRLQQSGVGHLSVDQLIRLRDQGADEPSAVLREALAAIRSYYRSVIASLRV
ncbi:MAG: M56 family metallopeptidase, partial [Vicinamibacterales bacterium]